MKYCPKCGNELKKDEKFCRKCGSKIKVEKDIGKIILFLGVFLVIFSSFIFGIISWNNYGDLFKILFFAFETVLFFGLSFALRKIGEKTSRAFFIIGLFLIPYTLTLIPIYNIVKFTSSASIYIYLAILYFLTSIFYLLVNIKFKSIFVNYMSLIALLLSFINVGLIFNNHQIIALLIVSYIVIINVLSKIKVFDDKFNTVLKNASLIIGLLAIPYYIFVFGHSAAEKLEFLPLLFNSITFVLILFDIYFKLYNKSKILDVVAPFILSIVSIVFISYSLYNFGNLFIYIVAVFACILYFVSLLFNNNTLKITSLISFYLTFLFLFIGCSILPSSFELFIISLISLISNIVILIINKYSFVHFIIAISLLSTISAFINTYFDFTYYFSGIICSIIFMIMYIVLKLLNKKHSFFYLICALFVCFINIISGSMYIYFGLINSLVLLVAFILTFAFEEHVSLRIITYVLLNIVLIDTFDNFYYTALAIGGSTLFSGLLLDRFTKFNLKPYILYSEILILIVTLFNSMNYSIYVLFINIFIFAIAYLALLKYHNKTPYRLLYVITCLITVERIIYTLINVNVIASLIAIILVLIILIVMYLMDADKSVNLTIVSLVILYPYYRLIGEFTTDIFELYVLPFIVYDIILTTIINFKNEMAKRLWTIIPLSIMAYIFLISSKEVVPIIIDFVFALLFIIIGLVRKYNLMIYFGIVFIVLILLFKMFTIVNSAAIIITILILGLTLIGIALFTELKKKN